MSFLYFVSLSNEKQRKKEQREMLFHNIIQQILNGKLLLTVIDGQKSNFNGEFKLKLVTILHLGFVVKIL